MEEDISKCVINASEDAISEDEVIENNWTFVITAGDISCTKNNGADISDNYSEQGSDSGSSIVVIDSPVVPSYDLHPVLGHTIHQELLQNVEEQAESFDVSDNISYTSHQSSNNEFLKECSPYEEMEQPDTWDCDHETDQPGDGGVVESKIMTNNLVCPSSQLLDELGKQIPMILTENNIEINTNLESVENEKIILKDFIPAEKSDTTIICDVTCPKQHQSVPETDEPICDFVSHTNTNTNSKYTIEIMVKVEETSAKGSIDQQTIVLSETEISDLESDVNLQLIKSEDAIINDSYEHNRVDENPHIGEQQQEMDVGLTNSENLFCDEYNRNSTETHEDANVVQSIISERKLELNQDTDFSSHDDQPKSARPVDDDQSSDSMEDESEDETWDLSLEALMNINSLASSVSSLVQPSFSPSPMLIPADGYQRSHAMLKPDLLEEANRIEELDLMDYSAVTNPDLPAEIVVGNIVPDRHYVHHPNQRLNEKLSFVMAFALAAVIGFAIGHLIGLSDNFPSRCSLRDEQIKHDGSRSYEGWTEEDWLVEVKRLTSYNEDLNRALKDLSSQDSTSCRFDFQVNELLTENWDLKQSIGRIRYGTKPTRSVEDRDTINRLQTENQDLRATVGKLRYLCGQPISNSQQQEQAISNPSKAFVPRLSASETLWETLGVNLTSDWNHLINYHPNGSIEDQLNSVKESAIDCIRLIGSRHDELINLTRENNNKVTEKMETRFKKSVKKTVELLKRVNKEHESFVMSLEEVESRLEKLRSKLEFHWSNLLQSYSIAGNRFGTLESDKPLNSDWFFAMGQQRDKMRRNEKQSEWMFDRAKNRELERKSRKFQTKQKKQKTFQGNSWNHYSSAPSVFSDALKKIFGG